MSDTTQFEPKIVAYVCNWCTYLGADLAGTTRLEYPPNVRIVRLPCTGRIDFNLIVKGFEVGADAIIVSGCHPGDCHYTSGNYHARRRWILFRALLDVLGFDLERIHFAWISAAEGKKFQQVVTEVTEKTRQMGPYTELYAAASAPSLPQSSKPALPLTTFAGEGELRAHAKKLLTEDAVKVVIGYGERGPVLITRPEDTDKLVWNSHCTENLAMYLKRKEVKALGKPAIVVKACDERSLVVLEKESQLDRKNVHVIGMACEGLGAPKCAVCTSPMPRFADQVIGQATDKPVTEQGPNKLDALMQLSRSERMAYWTGEFERCVKCYACRQVCPMCYCERCLVDKSRPIEIDPAPSTKGNFAWHIARAFHLTGRCVGCGSCADACPVGIDLGLLNMQLAKAAREHFDGYQAGVDPSAAMLIGSFAKQDKEEFIK
jgi:coenzyme F420-reducing hydrogenase delta subunit/formate hydrogenlyase subunit 6/NADH:ubiquinone oxidoreductase subunit I